MGVDHGDFDIRVTQEFLNRSYIVAVFEEVSGEVVPKGRLRTDRRYVVKPVCPFWQAWRLV